LLFFLLNDPTPRFASPSVQIITWEPCPCLDAKATAIVNPGPRAVPPVSSSSYSF